MVGTSGCMHEMRQRSLHQSILVSFIRGRALFSLSETSKAEICVLNAVRLENLRSAASHASCPAKRLVNPLEVVTRYGPTRLKQLMPQHCLLTAWRSESRDNEIS